MKRWSHSNHASTALAARDGSEQPRHEIGVGVGLVGEAAPVARDGDEPGLRAFDQVGKVARGPVGARHLRYRRPARRRGQPVFHDAAHGLAQAQAVPGGRRHRGRPVLAAGRCVREQRAPALDVVGKPAAGEHDAAARVDCDLARLRGDHSADDAGVVDQQTRGRARHPELDAEVERRLGESRDQRIAGDQPHAAAVQCEVDEVPGDALRHVGERAPRPHRIHEMREVRAHGDAHAPGRDQVQRRTQLREPRTELARVEWRRAYRAATLARPGTFGVEIGNRVAVDERERSPRLEELDHPRTLFEERVDARRVVAIPELMLQVGPRRIRSPQRAPEAAASR